MKRILLIILAFVYLGLSQGPTVYLHYCMGELVQMGLEHPGESSNCDFCGMSKTSSDKEACCQQDVKSIQIDNVQKIVKSEFHFEQAPVLLPKTLIERFLKSVPDKGIQTYFPDQETPPLQDIPVFVRNCTYRI
jgi:hypothetical protein